MAKITAIIVDDHQLFRDGLKFVLNQGSQVEVIAEAADGREFISIIDNYDPDVVLMDISMPEMDGITATKIALEKKPELKIIALSMFGDEEYYYKMIHAGVMGFVLKESGSSDLENAIAEVMAGNNYFSQELLRNIILNFNPAKEEEEPYKCTKREREVLSMLCRGYATSEISKKLNISQRTVEGHKSNLFSKTGVNSTVNLIMFAIKNKLVEL